MFVEFKKVIRARNISGRQVASVTQSCSAYLPRGAIEDSRYTGTGVQRGSAGTAGGRVVVGSEGGIRLTRMDVRAEPPWWSKGLCHLAPCCMEGRRSAQETTNAVSCLWPQAQNEGRVCLENSLSRDPQVSFLPYCPPKVVFPSFLLFWERT